MQRFNIFFFAILAALSLAACDSGNLGGPEDTTLVERIQFALQGDEPVVAAPDDEVTYTFRLSYSKGLASALTTLDGEVIVGSEKTWDDAPVEADYTFRYVVKGAQFGETLDFVFSATGVDGSTFCVDYALWVAANAVEFSAVIPAGVPSQIYSDASVSFDLAIECGNVLKSVVITKNDQEYASKTDFTTEKIFKYPFTYTPSAEDVDRKVTFHFVVTDVKDNKTEAFYEVDVVKADLVGKMLYEEIFDTSMSISTTTAYNTTVGGITGGGATQFDVTTIKRYNTLLVADPENPDGEMVANVGAMEGCTVYDGDISALTYTSDGADVCLSKLEKLTEFAEVTGTYLWYRKTNNGWFRVDGIRLHGATSLKLTYTQATRNGKMKVEYSADGGTTWVEIMATDVTAELHEQKFSLSQAAENISLRFVENGGSAHVRIDNIRLVEVL